MKIKLTKNEKNIWCTFSFDNNSRVSFTWLCILCWFVIWASGQNCLDVSSYANLIKILWKFIFLIGMAVGNCFQEEFSYYREVGRSTRPGSTCFVTTAPQPFRNTCIIESSIVYFLLFSLRICLTNCVYHRTRSDRCLFLCISVHRNVCM